MLCSYQERTEKTRATKFQKFFKGFERDFIITTLWEGQSRIKSIRAMVTEIPVLPYAVNVKVAPPNGKLCVKYVAY